jgi:hypothetical protein
MKQSFEWGLKRIALQSLLIFHPFMYHTRITQLEEPYLTFFMQVRFNIFILFLKSCVRKANTSCLYGVVSKEGLL